MGDPFKHAPLKVGMVVRLSGSFLDELCRLCAPSGTSASAATDAARRRRYRVRKIWSDAGAKTSVLAEEIDAFGSSSGERHMFFDYDLEPAD